MGMYYDEMWFGDGGGVGLFQKFLIFGFFILVFVNEVQLEEILDGYFGVNYFQEIFVCFQCFLNVGIYCYWYWLDVFLLILLVGGRLNYWFIKLVIDFSSQI